MRELQEVLGAAELPVGLALLAELCQEISNNQDHIHADLLHLRDELHVSPPGWCPKSAAEWMKEA